MEQLTISMAILKSFLYVYQGGYHNYKGTIGPFNAFRIKGYVALDGVKNPQL
jgi:hypothetical protein